MTKGPATPKDGGPGWSLKPCGEWCRGSAGLTRLGFAAQSVDEAWRLGGSVRGSDQVNQSGALHFTGLDRLFLPQNESGEITDGAHRTTVPAAHFSEVRRYRNLYSLRRRGAAR
jgi:hypothetical protein